MKANFTGVTATRVQDGSWSEWQKRDKAQKHKIEQAAEDKQLADTIMDCLGDDIAEMRKPHGLQVIIEPWEARLILEKGGIVYAKHGRIRERCWLTGDGEMLVGMVPARLVDVTEFDTEIWIFGENE